MNVQSMLTDDEDESPKLRAKGQRSEHQREDDDDAHAPLPGAATATATARDRPKWTPEEDDKLIQLRNECRTWEEISRHFQGRTAISCRLHYQNYVEKKAWSEDSKDKLARVYERCKKDMWLPVAADMRMPWRSVEAMHWVLGETEMRARAGLMPPPPSSTSMSGPTTVLPPPTLPFPHHRGPPGPGHLSHAATFPGPPFGDLAGSQCRHLLPHPSLLPHIAATTTNASSNQLPGVDEMMSNAETQSMPSSHRRK